MVWNRIWKSSSTSRRWQTISLAAQLWASGRTDSSLSVFPEIASSSSLGVWVETAESRLDREPAVFLSGRHPCPLLAPIGSPSSPALQSDAPAHQLRASSASERSGAA